MTQTQVAVLGLGAMGAPIANRLSPAFQVTAWTRSGRPAAPLAETVRQAESPSEAVTGASIVVTVLPDADTTRSVLASASNSLRPDTLWLQLGTVGVGIDQLAEFARSRQLRLVDAPVQGTRQPAEQGKLVAMAAAPEGYRAEAGQVLDHLAARTLWIGDGPGAASRLKLALNVWVSALTNGIAESLAVADALNVDPRLVVDVVTGGPMDSGFFQSKANAALGRQFEASFTVHNAIKDSHLVLAATHGLTVPTPVTAGGLERWELTAQFGHGDKDMIASVLAGETA